MDGSLSKHLIFNLDKFDDWKLHMQAHLFALHEEMWKVITEGPIKIMMVNTVTIYNADVPRYILKPRLEWTPEDRKRNNLDNIAKDILFKAVDDTIFLKIKRCGRAKQIWEVLLQISEGNEEVKEHKLIIAMKKFEDFKMLPGESIADMETRFLKLLKEIGNLGREISQKEISLKILRGLPKVWKMKVIVMRECRDLKVVPTAQLFKDLKDYELEMSSEDDEEANEPKNTAWITNQPSTSSRSNSNPSEFLTDEQFSLFLRKFKRFMRENYSSNHQASPSSSTKRPSEKLSGSKSRVTNKVQRLCYNCRRPGHFKAECPYPLVRKHQQ